MSAAKHTAGPWAVNPMVAQVDAFLHGQPLPVCQLLWPTDKRSEAETEANARLIAAAPDLLAAAQAAWNCVIELPPSQARVELAQMLQAAIEKAVAQC